MYYILAACEKEPYNKGRQEQTIHIGRYICSKERMLPVKLAFFDTKPYDHIYFDGMLAEAGIKTKFFENKLTEDTAPLTRGFDAVCVFVNDNVNERALEILAENGVKLIALRCSGYNNVDFKAAFEKIHVVRVPSYSPRAVAEHAMALILSLNRKIPKAHNRTRDGNFTLNGLMGMDLYGKTAGIVGTGQIGRCFIEICRGFGMEVIAYDPFPIPDSGICYVSKEELFTRSDVISLHCPLTNDTKHMINGDSIARMKKGVYIINTSRGGLIDTDALIGGIKSQIVGGAGLDVYEEESDYFYEDLSAEIITDDNLLRLVSYPNVLITAHQAFFTREAIYEIARVTVENLNAFRDGGFLENEICYNCLKKGNCTVKNERKNCF